MKLPKIFGIAALAAAASLGVNAYAADTYIADRNEKLAQFEESSNYELFISANWCNTCNLLKENMRKLGDEPDAEIVIQKGTDLYDIRRELRTDIGQDLPRGIPLMLDKVDGEVTIYYGFGQSEEGPVMYQWDGFKKAPTDKRVLLEKILD